ncbi:MAG TPA: DUF2628 domain-containing protein [Rhizobiaceae bacterium]|nr:DUF2628 domain-containing protein [Rhizobiaceae bacterium]
MASYVVFEQPGGGESPVFVRDSFRWPAFLAPLLWFLWCRMWIEALLVFAVMTLFVALGETSGFAALIICLAFFLSFALGFEGPALRMAALRRGGWEERGVVDARDREEAEIRYLSEVGEVDEPAPSPPVARPDRETRLGAPRPQRPGLGLLDYPGGA